MSNIPEFSTAKEYDDFMKEVENKKKEAVKGFKKAAKDEIKQILEKYEFTLQDLYSNVSEAKTEKSSDEKYQIELNIGGEIFTISSKATVIKKESHADIIKAVNKIGEVKPTLKAILKAYATNWKAHDKYNEKTGKVER